VQFAHVFKACSEGSRKTQVCIVPEFDEVGRIGFMLRSALHSEEKILQE